MDPNNPNPTPPANNTPPAATPPANTPPADGGGNPPANNPPANPPAPTPPASDPPPADGGNPPANGEGEKPATPPKDPGDIFDDLKTDEAKQAEAAEAAKAALAEYAKAAGFDGELQDLVLGQGKDAVTIPAEDVGTVVGALKGANVPAEQAKGVLATVALLDKVRNDRQAAAENTVLANLRKEAETEFGDDFRKVVGDAQAGAVALFGAELWEDIKSVRALTHDKRFLRAMASYGRSRRSDTGGPAPAPGASPDGSLTFDMASFAKGMK
jgi:hypothetical protein